MDSKVLKTAGVIAGVALAGLCGWSLAKSVKDSYDDDLLLDEFDEIDDDGQPVKTDDAVTTTSEV